MGNTDIGGRIEQVRGKMTQQEFAGLLGVNPKTVNRYESGDRLPDADFLIKLNVLFKVQPLWLLTGRGEDTSGEKVTPYEMRLLANFRMSSAKAQDALLETSAALAQPKKVKTKKKTGND